MNISGLDKAEILAALYNGSCQQGLGILNPNGKSQMTVEQAREELKHETKFDYLHGRVMKIDLTGDEVETWLYNRDRGDGAAEKIIESIKNNMQKHLDKDED